MKVAISSSMIMLALALSAHTAPLSFPQDQSSDTGGGDGSKVGGTPGGDGGSTGGGGGDGGGDLGNTGGDGDLVNTGGGIEQNNLNSGGETSMGGSDGGNTIPFDGGASSRLVRRLSPLPLGAEITRRMLVLRQRIPGERTPAPRLAGDRRRRR